MSIRLLIALVIWIGAVAAAVELSSVVAGSIHNHPASASAKHPAAPSANRPAAASFDASSVTATDPRSLFRSANFELVLAAARAHLGVSAKLEMLVLYPGYLDLTVVRSGSELNVYIDANGRYGSTNTGGNPGSSPLFSLTRVTSDAPATVARRIATSGHVPTSQLNYMVAEVDPADHHFRWLVYPRRGSPVEYFQVSGATGRLLEYLANSATGLQPVR